MASTSITRIPIQKFNFIDTPKILNRDSTIDIYLFVNGELHWVILMPDINDFHVKRYKIDEKTFYMSHIITQKPNENGIREYRMHFRRKYVICIPSEHDTIYFQRINALSSEYRVVNIEVEDSFYNECIMDIIPRMLLEMISSKEQQISIESREDFEGGFIDRCNTAKVLYYSEKMKKNNIKNKYNQTMKEIIDYYNENEDVEWKDAVFHVVGVRGICGKEEIDEPCIPAGEKLTWATYIKYCRE
jgi:hypothetical protein